LSSNAEDLNKIILDWYGYQAEDEDQDPSPMEREDLPSKEDTQCSSLGMSKWSRNKEWLKD
jgi:hypothetical protein